MKLISFIIPCYGSENTITPVINEIDEVVSKNKNYNFRYYNSDKNIKGF